MLAAGGPHFQRFRANAGQSQSAWDRILSTSGQLGRFGLITPELWVHCARTRPNSARIRPKSTGVGPAPLRPSSTRIRPNVGGVDMASKASAKLCAHRGQRPRCFLTVRMSRPQSRPEVSLVEPLTSLGVEAPARVYVFTSSTDGDADSVADLSVLLCADPRIGRGRPTRSTDPTFNHPSTRPWTQLPMHPLAQRPTHPPIRPMPHTRAPLEGPGVPPRYLSMCRIHARLSLLRPASHGTHPVVTPSTSHPKPHWHVCLILVPSLPFPSAVGAWSAGLVC